MTVQEHGSDDRDPSASDAPTLSIGEVSRQLNLAVSTLRYWEERGLIRSAGRRGGRRHFDYEEVYRVALIQMWRDAGLLSLDDIAEILASKPGKETWRSAVRRRLELIEEQQHKLAAAERRLRHLLTCPSPQPAADCPYLRDEAREHAARPRILATDPAAGNGHGAANPGE